MRNTITARVVIGSMLGLALFTSNAEAQKNWVGSTSNDWFDGTNWSPTGIPTQSSLVEINNGGTAQVKEAGDVAFSVALGKTSGSSGKLEISAGGVLTTNLTSAESYIGHTGTGTLSISGGGKFNTYRAGLGVLRKLQKAWPPSMAQTRFGITRVTSLLDPRARVR